MSQRSYNDQPGWVEESTITRKMNVHIPLKLQLVCNNIAKRVGGNEFSIYCRIDRKEGNNIYLSDFYVIPEQTVSPASIDYGKDPDTKVDTVIHRHPDGLNSFSGTDESYINRNFECSILYTKAGGFVYGIYNMDMGNDVKLRLDVEPIITDGLGEIDISMIKEKKYEYNKPGTSNRGYEYYVPKTIHDFEESKNDLNLTDDGLFSHTTEKTPLEKFKEKWEKEDNKKKHLINP